MHRFIQISFPILFIAVDISLLKITLCDPKGATERVGLSFLYVNIGIINIGINCFNLKSVWEALAVHCNSASVAIRIGKTKL